MVLGVSHITNETGNVSDVCVDLHGPEVQNRRVPVSIKYGLRTANCGLRTGYKTRTEV